ncbi:ABC transporter permease [Roseospira navarrensis]|uniref:ABC transporter permease subunit n=1 Tax=Roseospira navarrensis TaxID=140058 RepID=A0A7X2D6L7_9PROT|nr:iron ABC transporter permease [Roseospira navarrensis]MQX38380.1 ABC transporter permease subunit [Roseospira navarrensis]
MPDACAIASPDHRPRRLPGPWTWGSLLVAGLVALPLLAVFALAAFPHENIWPHLAATVLPRYLTTTLSLMVAVGAGTLVIGITSAWLVTMYRFPGQRVFEWAMLMPLAVPAYVIAYVYTDLLEYAGPVQGAIRAVFGFDSAADYWFPEIRSLPGAAVMMTAVFYPYVYLLARSAFVEQSVCVLEVSRTLGCGPWASFRRVALPLARPSIVVGLALVLMETLNDFGTVDYFAVQTLTAGLYNVWLILHNRAGAAQIALVLMGFVVLLIVAERMARRKRGYQATSTKTRSAPGVRLRGWRAALATTACAAPVVTGFVVPAGVLAWYAAERFSESWTPDFIRIAVNSLGLAGGAALIAVAVGLFLAYAVRLDGGRGLRLLVRFAGLGYAIPGAVLAVGVLTVLGGIDGAVDGFMEDTFGLDTGLLLSGTVFALLFAYTVRFLALSHGTLEAGLGRVRPSLDMAARTLGRTPGQVLREVHAPLVRGSLFTAALLVFVDCMKELPATLILRPFNFDTLATHVYQYASDELLEQSALAALCIVLAGLLPVLLLSRSISRARDWGTA